MRPLALLLLVGTLACNRLEGQGPFNIPIAGKGYDDAVLLLPGQDDATLIVWKWTYGGPADYIAPPPVIWLTGDTCTNKQTGYVIEAAFQCTAYDSGCCNGYYNIQSDVISVENTNDAQPFSDTSFAHELCHAWHARSGNGSNCQPDHWGPCFRGTDGNVGTEGSMLYEANRRLKVVGL